MTTYELREKDKNDFEYCEFDEYVISNSVLHYNNKMYFLLSSKAMDNETWASEEIMLDNHLYVSGPNRAIGSGMMWFMERYAVKVAEDPVVEAYNEFLNQSEEVSQILQPKNTFKGYSIVVQPVGDLSYLDLLPQRGGANNMNFTTFLNDQEILINFSGRFLIFSPKGLFLGQVQFTGVNDGFRSSQIKLVTVSDSGKYYVFQGPRFLTKTEQEEKKKKSEAKK